MQTAMEIHRVEREGCPELVVSGRLDSYWARHLAEALDEVIREGNHHIRLNLAATSYISSAGIRVLLQAYQQFASVAGTLRIVEPSPAVRQILELAGLRGLLTAPAPQRTAGPQAAVATREYQNCTLEVYPLVPGEHLLCKLAGHPEQLLSDGFGESDCTFMPMPRGVIALGLGALGETFEDCRERFGEFMAVAGCAACQPTDETGCADYVLSTGTLVPRVATLYSLSCKGRFGHFLRFDSHPRSGPVGLAGIVEACMQTAQTGVAGIVLLAESSGVMGASLKRSPARPHGALFHHPEVREWLSFSPVRTHTRSVVLAAGVAVQDPCPPELRALLRPVKRNSTLIAHFHAAVFSYRALRKGYIELESEVEHLFDSGGLQCVVHLLADDRAGCGAETEFTRGACWVGPISRILGTEETL